jgi:hypothetical protein
MHVFLPDLNHLIMLEGIYDKENGFLLLNVIFELFKVYFGSRSSKSKFGSYSCIVAGFFI